MARKILELSFLLLSIYIVFWVIRPWLFPPTKFEDRIYDFYREQREVQQVHNIHPRNGQCNVTFTNGNIGNLYYKYCIPGALVEKCFKKDRFNNEVTSSFICSNSIYDY